MAGPGIPGEATLVADARQLVQMAAEHFGEPLFILGESLGAGVAAATVADGHPRVRGVALLTPWNTLPDAAQAHYPYLPVRWLLKDRYDSTANLAHFPRRVAIIVAGADSIIPATLGEKLYADHKGEKRLWRFPEADHNTWPAGADQLWWGEVMRYLEAEDGKSN
ncbi:MAG TPA: alpha/beta hydrolase [Rhodocyclaceae bacterium]|nr:alpha/beta hydrolase [Rhodocyclaceae bacterium]